MSTRGRGTLRLARVALLSVGLLLLAGCWDNRYINHRALPTVMGVAEANGQYQVFLYIPSPGTRLVHGEVVSETGKTISDIVERIGMNLETNVDLLHMKVVIFDKKLAENGLEDSISGFMRARDVSPKTMAVVCEDPLDRFFAHLTGGTHDAIAICNLFENNIGRSPQISETRVWQVFRSIHSYTRDLAIPIVRIGTDTAIQFEGSAIIKNGKMVGRIGPEETFMVNAFNGRSTNGYIEVMDHATVQVVGNTVSHRSSIVDGRPLLASRLRLKVTVLETRGDPSPDLIRREQDRQLTVSFDRMFRSAQSHRADILSSGQWFRNKLPRERLEQWRTKDFPNLRIDFGTDAIIQNTGKLKAP